MPNEPLHYQISLSFLELIDIQQWCFWIKFKDDVFRKESHTILVYTQEINTKMLLERERERD